MFGNYPFATVVFGGELVTGQGFDPLNPDAENKIFIPGDTESGDMSATSGINIGDVGEAPEIFGGDMGSLDIQAGDGGPEMSSGESWDSGDYDSSY